MDMEREGRSTYRIPIRVRTRDVEIRSWSQEWSKREGMVGKKVTRDFLNQFSNLWLYWELKIKISNEVILELVSCLS